MPVVLSHGEVRVAEVSKRERERELRVPTRSLGRGSPSCVPLHFPSMMRTAFADCIALQDFSVTAMIKWDTDSLYLALDVIDDKHMGGGACYKNGVQVAFEVGGPASKGQDGGSLSGVLQAKRSTTSELSRLHLLNVGLGDAQNKCQCTNCARSAHTPAAEAIPCAADRPWLL